MIDTVGKIVQSENITWQGPIECGLKAKVGTSC